MGGLLDGCRGVLVAWSLVGVLLGYWVVELAYLLAALSSSNGVTLAAVVALLGTSARSSASAGARAKDRTYVSAPTARTNNIRMLVSSW